MNIGMVARLGYLLCVGVLSPFGPVPAAGCEEGLAQKSHYAGRPARPRLVRQLTVRVADVRAQSERIQTPLRVSNRVAVGGSSPPLIRRLQELHCSFL